MVYCLSFVYIKQHVHARHPHFLIDIITLNVENSIFNQVGNAFGRLSSLFEYNLKFCHITRVQSKLLTTSGKQQNYVSFRHCYYIKTIIRPWNTILIVHNFKHCINLISVTKIGVSYVVTTYLGLEELVFQLEDKLKVTIWKGLKTFRSFDIFTTIVYVAIYNLQTKSLCFKRPTVFLSFSADMRRIVSILDPTFEITCLY